MSAADGITGAKLPNYGAIGLLVVGGILAFGASVCRALDECSSAQTARLVSISVPIALGGMVGITQGYWRGSTPTKANPGVV